MVGWNLRRILGTSVWGSMGEFSGNFLASYYNQRARQKLRDPREIEAALTQSAAEAVKGLEQCKPISDHLTNDGINKLRRSLNRNDHFGALLAIDGNTKITKRDICISLLKIAATGICKGYCVEDIRAATYTMLVS